MTLLSRKGRKEGQTCPVEVIRLKLHTLLHRSNFFDDTGPTVGYCLHYLQFSRMAEKLLSGESTDGFVFSNRCQIWRTWTMIEFQTRTFQNGQFKSSVSGEKELLVTYVEPLLSIKPTDNKRFRTVQDRHPHLSRDKTQAALRFLTY